MPLTVDEVCTRLRIGRSATLRMLHTGQLAGTKTHACGTPCGSPNTCKQGTWAISEESLRAVLAPVLKAGS